MLHADDEGGVEPLDRADELDRLEARKQVPVGDLELEPCDVGAEAEVLADAERQMRVRVAVDAEVPGISETSSSRFADG